MLSSSWPSATSRAGPARTAGAGRSSGHEPRLRGREREAAGRQCPELVPALGVGLRHLPFSEIAAAQPQLDLRNGARCRPRSPGPLLGRCRSGAAARHEEAGRGRQAAGSSVGHRPTAARGRRWPRGVGGCWLEARSTGERSNAASKAEIRSRAGRNRRRTTETCGLMARASTSGPDRPATAGIGAGRIRRAPRNNLHAPRPQVKRQRVGAPERAHARPEGLRTRPA